MFKSLIVLSAATAVFASFNAKADAYVSVGQQAYLPSCGGTVSVNNGGNGDQLNVVLSGVQNCKTFGDYKLGGEQGNYSGSFTVSTNVGSNNATFLLTSNSGAHSDTVQISYTKALVVSVPAAAYLSSCGGTLSFNAGGYGNQVNVVFSGVRECKTVELGSNRYSLQGGEGNYSGSYTISPSTLSVGDNWLAISVHSESQKHRDDVNAEFNVSYKIQ